MATKLTTGLAGLKVNRHPYASLKHYYERTLAVLQKMPEDAAYRRHTETIINSRQALLNQEKDVSALEGKFGGEPIEQLILQAQRELSLARRMLTWQPWQPLIEHAPKDQWKWPL